MDFQKEFFDASQNGHYNVVKLLLEDNRVNPADDNNSAIQWASKKGHYNVVKLLLRDNSINPADDNNWAIQLASRYGHYNVVKLLSKNNRVINFVKISDDNNLAILWASFYGHYNVIKLLLKHINSFNNDIINYIKKNCSKEINDFYKKYFNLYRFIDKNIFLLINYICNTTIKLSINYKLPKQLKDFILLYYVYNYRQNL